MATGDAMAYDGRSAIGDAFARDGPFYLWVSWTSRQNLDRWPMVVGFGNEGQETVEN